MLALRMGLPIFLLLVTTLVLFALPEVLNSLLFKTFLLCVSVLTIVYYIFYLINQEAVNTLIDPLTKAYNRENIIKELQRMQKKQLLNSISLIQIKNIAELNNYYGYERVNSILSEFVKRLDLHLKNNQDIPIIGKLQGSDFIVGSVLAPKNIRNSLLEFQMNNIIINGVELEILSAVSVNTNDIIKNVEHLYDSLHHRLSKESKNGIYIQDIKNLSKFESEIVEAVRGGKLDLRFRPIQDLRSGKINNYEAIIKLQTQSFGKLPTNRYIPVINRLDLEQTFDLAIVEKISTILKSTQNEICISFNISPFSLRNEEFAQKLFEMIEKHGVEPKRYILELYENKVYHDIQKYKKTLNRLKGFGVQLCLDNFGAMNASLEYIKYLPVDIVQFDNEFSKNLDQPSYKATLKAFVKMCQELKIQTILKWIDNEQQKELAKELEVDFIQGFKVGKLKTQKDLE